jgi:hypothetical protein
MRKIGRKLAIGDVLADMPVREPKRGPRGKVVEKVETIPGGLIEDFRPSSLNWPMSVAVKIGGEWRPLPAEGSFEIEAGK